MLEIPEQLMPFICRLFTVRATIWLAMCKFIDNKKKACTIDLCWNFKLSVALKNAHFILLETNYLAPGLVESSKIS